MLNWLENIQFFKIGYDSEKKLLIISENQRYSCIEHLSGIHEVLGSLIIKRKREEREEV